MGYKSTATKSVVFVTFLALTLIFFFAYKLNRTDLTQLKNDVQNLNTVAEVKNYLGNNDFQWSYHEAANYRGQFTTHLKKIPEARSLIVVDVVEGAKLLQGEKRYDLVIFFGKNGEKLKTSIYKYNVQGPL